MSSIVLDLQSEVTKSDCEIVSVLRKAHLIAAKLGLTDFDKWILCELNGYKSDDNIPDYRIIRGQLKAYNPYHGWIPTMMYDSELEDEICRIPVKNSVSEIISLYSQKEEGIGVEFTGEKLAFINSLFDSPTFMKYGVHLSPPALIDIVEKDKIALLEWTVKLESEGILGEGMQFDTTEKATAKTIPQTINNYYGSTSVINAPVEGPVVAGNNNTIEFTYEKACDAVAEIESAIEEENISAENKENAIEMLTEIREKITQQKKPSFIKSALVGLEDFLISEGASAAVAIVEAKMQGLF